MDAAIEMVRKSRRKIGVTSNKFVVSVNVYLRQVRQNQVLLNKFSQGQAVF